MFLASSSSSPSPPFPPSAAAISLPSSEILLLLLQHGLVCFSSEFPSQSERPTPSRGIVFFFAWCGDTDPDDGGGNPPSQTPPPRPKSIHRAFAARRTDRRGGASGRADGRGHFAKREGVQKPSYSTRMLLGASSFFGHFPPGCISLFLSSLAFSASFPFISFLLPLLRTHTHIFGFLTFPP